MLLWSEPYYTYSFGSMEQTLETALQTEFFKWFHLEETERRPEAPNESVRFRPSGPKFHDLCYLDILTSGGGAMVRMELVARRDYVDGRDGVFAQDMVKSFLLAALPAACQAVLADFMREITALPAKSGATPGCQAFRGLQSAWSAQTGWSRVVIANLHLPEGPTLVVQVGPNPGAPNAKLIA
jgi:hypothetical protein